VKTHLSWCSVRTLISRQKGGRSVTIGFLLKCETCDTCYTCLADVTHEAPPPPPPPRRGGLPDSLPTTDTPAFLHVVSSFEEHHCGPRVATCFLGVLAFDRTIQSRMIHSPLGAKLIGIQQRLTRERSDNVQQADQKKGRLRRNNIGLLDFDFIFHWFFRLQSALPLSQLPTTGETQ
jgi:hypothetical protein